MTRFLTLTTALTVAASAAFSGGHGHGADVKLSDNGYFVDGHEMTLYTFDKDDAGKSNCYGGCAKAWPPLLVEAAGELPEGFSTVTRKDGSEQIAYDGQPLYLWIQDKKPGQTTGDGVQGVWHIAKP